MFVRLVPHCFFICILMVSSAQAGFILQVDLRTANQVTISATSELSLASKSGSDRVGVYLKDFFGTAAMGYFDVNSNAGNSLVYFNAISDGTPGMSHDAFDPGLNLHSLTDGSAAVGFTAGVQAFKGSATWHLNANVYETFLLAPASGDVYAFALSLIDLSGALNPVVIGQYEVLSVTPVPEPTSMAIFGLGALGMAYLARRKRMV